MKEVNILEKGKKFQEIETNYFQNLTLGLNIYVCTVLVIDK